MDLELILKTASECLALKPDGLDGNPDAYDSAILGITDDGQLIYSKEKMVEIALTLDSDMTDEDAWQFLEYNVFYTYVDEQTPIFINTFG